MKLIYIYLLCINALSFLLYGLDKLKARKNRRRVPERSLIALACFGGTVGALLAMYFFHHKTRKNKFRLGLPLILLIQIALLSYCILMMGDLPCPLLFLKSS